MANLKQRLEILINAQNNASNPLNKLRTDADAALGNGSGGKKGLAGLSLGAAGAIAAVGGGLLAMGAGLKASVEKAAEFEASMSKVSAITGATGESLSALETLAKDMGTSTAFSASEAADGITFLGQAGFKTDEIMSALPETLNLAAAGGIGLGEAADIASNVLSGMRLPVEELAHVTDALATASSNSNTNVEQLGNAFAMVAPGAAAAGVSLDETAAALGVLADNGIQASSGGTSLNAALREMLKEGEAAGVSFVDQSGKLRSLTDIVGELEDANLSAKEVIEIFGDEGGRAINALVGSGVDRMQELTNAIGDSDGAAGDMAATMKDNLEGALTGLGSAFEGVQIALGEALLPILKTAVADYITPAVQATAKWIEEMGGLGEMFTDAVDFVGGAFSSIWNIADAFFSDSSFRDKFIKGISGMFSAGVTLFANYFRNLGILIGAAGRVLWEPIGAAFSALWEPIRRVAVQGINTVMTTVQPTINRIIRAINSVGEHFGTTINEVDFTPITQDAPKSMEDRWKETKRETAARFDEMVTAAENMGTDIERDAAALSVEVGKTWETTENVVDARVKGVVNKYKDGTKKIVDESKKTGKESGEVIVKEAAAAVEENAPALEASGRTLGLKQIKGFNDKLKAADGIGGALVGGLTDVMNGGSIKEAMADIGAQIGGMIGGPLGALAGQGLGMAVSAITGLFSGKGKAEKRKESIAELQSSISQGDIGLFNNFGQIKDTLANAGSAKITLDAVKAVFGLEDADAAELIKGLAAGGLTQAQREKFNEKLGANENLDSSDIVASLVPGGCAPPPANTLPPVDTSALPGDTAEQVSAGQDISSAMSYLQGAILNQRISKRRMEAFGAETITAAMRNLGGAPKGLREGLLDLARGGSPDNTPFNALGVDIIAGGGLQGVFSKPTTIMVGEQGAESVDITPFNGRGGFSGGGGGNYHFNFNINATDTRGVKEFIENDAREFIVGMMRRESERGRGVVFNGGVTNPPTV